VPHVVEHLVDIFRIGVEGLIEPCVASVIFVRVRRNSMTALRTSAPVFADHGIDVAQSLVCFRGVLRKSSGAVAFLVRAFTFWKSLS